MPMPAPGQTAVGGTAHTRLRWNVAVEFRGLRSLQHCGMKSLEIHSGSQIMHRPIFADRTALSAICRRHHVQRLALFGSTLRGADRADSDIDLLVEFEPGQEPGLLGLAVIEGELSALAGRRRIDLRSAQELSRRFRDEVVRSAKVQYAA